MSDKLHDNVLKNKTFLDNIFYNKGFLMKGFPVFLKVVRETNSDIPYSVIQSYYDNQEVVQAFKPQNKNLNITRPIISLLPFERIYCDTMYLTQPNSVLGFINIIDLFSKYAFSRCFILKNNTSSISSDKAKNTFNEFMNEIKQYNIPIGIVYTDRGSEYMGDFQKNLEEEGIIQIFANAGDKRKTAPIERFNKSLRLMLEKFKLVYGAINSKVLQTIILSYNNVSHAGLKYTPINILKSKEIQDKITSGYYELNNKQITMPSLTGHVRILIQSNIFKKVSPVWSTTIYKINSFSNGNYLLDGIPDKYFKRDELLSVDKNTLLKPDNIKQETIREQRGAIIPNKLRKEDLIDVKLPDKEKRTEKKIYVKVIKKVNNDIDFIKTYLIGKTFKDFDRKKSVIDGVIYSKTYKNYLVDYSHKGEEQQSYLYEVLEKSRREDWYMEHKDMFEEIIKKYKL